MIMMKNYRYKIITLDKEHTEWLESELKKLLPDDHAILVLSKLQKRKKN